MRQPEPLPTPDSPLQPPDSSLRTPASSLQPPRVSCICPTYGRPPDYLHLLEEAVESFLRQDWPQKELLILNDAPGQELVCDAPGVRVINAPQRFASLGEKYNAAIEAARGELICPWEDDDISLPWRIRLSVERLGDADYWNPGRYWFLDGRGLHSDHAMGVSHNGSIFRRSAWQRVGGYPPISGAQDAEFDHRLRLRCHVAHHEPLPVDQWFYIYRWGVSPTHLSGRQPHDAFYAEVGTQPLKSGQFKLRPHWRQNYAMMVGRSAPATFSTAATS